MTTYIINFVICSGLLLLVYRVFLGHENLYRFNRFYLLFSLVFSLTVPLITIQVPHMELPVFQSKTVDQPLPKAPVNIVQPTIAEQTTPTIVEQTTPIVTEAPAQTEAVTQAVTAQVKVPVQQPVAQTPVNIDYRYILFALYSIAMLVMLVRFIRNSWYISRLVTKNTIVNYEDTSLVLVDDKVTPHSFLKYVFINKDDYQSGAIEPEIICHEQAHIKQLHSLDVLFVELLQIVFWFNPFIPLYRRVMQLNHEFLADEEVIKNYHDTQAYQYLLLAKASQSGSMYLTSQFNYQVTKKRIIMMTKNTSAATAWIARLAVIPVITIAFLLFCNKTVAALKTISVKKTDKIVKANVISEGPSAQKPFPIIKYIIDYPSTNKGASEAVLKEYATIAGKYSNDRAYDNLKFKWPTLLPADRARLEQLFAQMSRKQQNAQKLAFTFQKQYPVIKPTQAQFDEWQAKKYRVYIDGKRIQTSQLSQRQPDEFYHYAVGREYYHYSTGHTYGVSLMTENELNASNKRIEGSHIIYYYHPPGETENKPTIKAVGQQSVPAEKNDATKQESPNVVTMVGRQTIPVIAQRDTKVIPPAKYDAPQEVLDEYLAILKKYNLPPGPEVEQVNFTTSKTDHLRLEDLFNKMSKKQQDMQVIKFGPLLLPASKRKITAEQLALWQDVKNYRVWINGKKIDQSDLAKHQPSEFDYYDAGRLAKTNPNYKKYRAEIYLMTPAYFKKDRERTIADRNQVMFYKAPKKDKTLSSVKDDSKPVVASKTGVPKGIKIRGEVAYPGDYVVQKSNVLEFLRAAGGIKPSGSIENVQVFREGTRVHIDFASANSKDILLPGDSVYVARIH